MTHYGLHGVGDCPSIDQDPQVHASSQAARPSTTAGLLSVSNTQSGMRTKTGQFVWWRDRATLQGHDWECNDSERQIVAALLDGDAESRGCQSHVREPEGHVCAWHCTLKSGRKWVGVKAGGDWSGPLKWCL